MLISPYDGNNTKIESEINFSCEKKNESNMNKLLEWSKQILDFSKNKKADNTEVDVKDNFIRNNSIDPNFNSKLMVGGKEYDIKDKYFHGVFGTIFTVSRKNSISAVKIMKFEENKALIETLTELKNLSDNVDKNAPLLLIFHFEINDNRLFIRMEVSKCSLRTMFNENLKLKDSKKIEMCFIISTLLLRNLKFLEKLNKVHFDLKPEAFVVTNDQCPWGFNIKFIDFGRNVSLVDKNAIRETFKNAFAEIAYMSPFVNQIEDQQMSDNIWSFGVILYELVYSKLPIELVNPRKLKEFINSNMDIVYPHLEVNFFDKFILIIQQCLFRKAEERPNAKDLCLQQSEILKSDKNLDRELIDHLEKILNS